MSSTKDRLLNVDMWFRFAYMLVFWLFFSVLGWVLGVIVVVQFILALVTGERNERLSDFGQRLGAYLREIVDFLCFVSEDKPFPFNDFPSGAETAPTIEH